MMSLLRINAIYGYMPTTNKDYDSYDKTKGNKTASKNNNRRKKMTTKSKTTKNNLENSKDYIMNIRPPTINYSTIIIKPSSSSKKEEEGKEGTKETLTRKAKDVEESIKHSLHIDRKTDDERMQQED
jgi:hypothetical protein